MAANPRREIAALSATLSTLLNKQLQQICAVNGLRTSGVKAELQRRIITALEENLYSDQRRYTEISNSIQNMRGPHGGYGSSNSYARGSPYSSSGNHQMPPIPQPAYGQNGYGYGQSPSRGGYGGAPGYGSRHTLQFKPSPFYSVDSQIGEVRTCEAMAQHRNTIHMALKNSEIPVLTRCTQDKSLRVMVFCAGDDHGIQDIAFPHQSELKVNGGEIRANLRGLKGKPGSTRPADITDQLRLDKYSYVNNVEFTYALTNKVKDQKPRSETSKYYLGIYVCKTVPVDQLVAKIKIRRIPKASVIQEITKASDDPDVVATSQVLSLKCPLSYMRLKTPCRGMTCHHIQCFDATSYLHLQEQGPQWLCPVCNKSAPFETLAIDEYARDILENTSESTEEVTIEPNAVWRTEHPPEPEPKRPRLSGESISVLDDEDEVAPLGDWAVISARNTQTPNRSMLGTPASGSGSATAGSKKRPAEVIDLTLSDDDDDEPIVRAPKRQNLGTTSTNSIPPAPGGMSFTNYYQ